MSRLRQGSERDGGILPSEQTLIDIAGPKFVPDLDQNAAKVHEYGQDAADGDGRRDADNGAHDCQGDRENGIEAHDRSARRLLIFWIMAMSP